MQTHFVLFKILSLLCHKEINIIMLIQNLILFPRNPKLILWELLNYNVLCDNIAWVFINYILCHIEQKATTNKNV